MFIVIALAGLSHVVKTWAWRLALRGEAKKVSFLRTLGLRLASEAIGQFGFVGLVFGESARVALLGPGVTAASAISSVTLDRGLFVATGALVTVAGILVAILGVAIGGALRIYAGIFVFALLGLLAMAALAVHKGWPLLSGTTRAAASIPWFRQWLNSKKAVIQSAESQFLQFHRQAPGAFWGSLLLNIGTHLLAIAEVYLILNFLGMHVSFVSALILESLTKLINVIGAIIPGNLGTYEGGNMVIGRLVGLSGGAGLILALCRRCRAIFWAIVGGICLPCLSRSNKNAGPNKISRTENEERDMPVQEEEQLNTHWRRNARVAIILANDVPASQYEPMLARVGALPVLLRVILGVQSKDPERIVVVCNRVTGPRMRLELFRSRRLRGYVEWLEVAAGTTLSSIIRRVTSTAGSARVILVAGDRTYKPALHRTVNEWQGHCGALELATGREPVGLFALSHEMAMELADDTESNVMTVQDLHRWITWKALSNGEGAVDYRLVEGDSWQQIVTPEDRVRAEQKLDRWLVKPTDGVFAKMNRRISIPISRQLIKFPITPNMVSLFTLGVSFAAGAFYALGGYWNTLLGAILSVWASILDGCDGEVARLKLQASDFGCWLETLCDYLYYLFIFVGMTVGLVRSTGNHAFAAWGAVLLFGAMFTILIAWFERSRLSGKQPEQFLTVWHKNAESHLSNPLLYIGRYTEFVIRRCFMPYALLVFALMNLTQLALYLTAIGANLAWMISLNSRITFSSKKDKVKQASAATVTRAQIV